MQEIRELGTLGMQRQEAKTEAWLSHLKDIMAENGSGLAFAGMEI